MRASLVSLFTSFTLVSASFGQSTERPGFLNVLNLVSVDSPTYLNIADFLFQEGEPVITGSESGFIALKAGTYPFTIRNEAATPKEETFPITIEPEKNVVVICFSESTQQEDGSITVKLQGTVLTELLETDLPRLSVVSLLEAGELPGRIGDRQVLFPRKRALFRSVEINDVIKIEARDATIVEVEISKKAHYIVFLFEDPKTRAISSGLVVNREFEFQSPETTESGTEISD